jgi:hypothetical protein
MLESGIIVVEFYCPKIVPKLIAELKDSQREPDFIGR